MKLERIVKDGKLILMSGDVQVLSIQEVQNDDTFEINLDGSLKSETAHELQDELEALAIMGFNLRVDMSKVQYMSSACADVFLKIQIMMDKRGKGSLVLLNVPVPILSEMNNTGLSELLMIE